MSRTFWNVSNSLSLLRIILVIPLSLYISTDEPTHRLPAVGLIVLIVLTDFCDGFLARRLGQVTDMGKILDPMADKLAVAVVSVILVVRGSMPLWFVLVVVARDLLILLGGLYLRKKKGIVLQSTPLGKWTVGMLSLYIFITVLGTAELMWFSHLMLLICVVLLVASFASYAGRFGRTVRAAELPPRR